MLGIWLIVSPFIFDYAGAGTLPSWHFVLGGLVAALARARALAGLAAERPGIGAA